MFKRELEDQIKKVLGQGKVVIIYGARQVGKTTLVKSLLAQYPQRSIYLNCDEPDIRQRLENKTSTELRTMLGENRLVMIDEAQRVINIGITLKLIADNFPDLQIIATGSSSFELSNRLVEPLTGRKREFYLFPLSYQEISLAQTDIEYNRMLGSILRFGSYPEVITGTGDDYKEQTIKSLATSYLYKDIFALSDMRKPEVLEKLLQALALQVGNEVSYNELSNLLGADKNTISSYIQLLEQAFIVFRLVPLSNNSRGQLKRKRKIYFYDNGIRNAIINNFNPLSLRQDTGALWENYLIAERIKWNHYNLKNKNIYFWRSHQHQEVDLIESYQGQYHAYELKLKERNVKIPSQFRASFPTASFRQIHQGNYQEFLRSN